MSAASLRLRTARSMRWRAPTACPDVEVISGATAGFRHRARLAIRGRLGSPKVGLFEFDTHRVVHIPNRSVCSLDQPRRGRRAPRSG